MALWQCWTWFAGMILISNGLHILGLNFGAPRRSALGTAPYVADAWQPLMIEAAIGGIILGISGLLFYINIVGTAASKEKLAEPIEMPVAEPLDANEVQNLPAWIDSWRPWLIATVALILIAYVPIFVTLISQYNPVPGFKVW